jgi:environmental stress-induced protein Ves
MAIVKAATQQRERWRNGGGWTRAIARGRIDGTPAMDADDWDWRLSIADIEADGPFSRFPGVDRVLVLLEGAGIDLAFADGASVRLVEPLARLAFAGERNVHCALIAGPTRDFNLMWRRERMRAALSVVDLGVGAAAIAVPAPAKALHVLTGALVVDGATAGAGDTVVPDACASAGAAVAAAGVGLLIVFEPR